MKLEQIAKGAQISGIEPGMLVRVFGGEPPSDNSTHVAYKADDVSLAGPNPP